MQGQGLLTMHWLLGVLYGCTVLLVHTYLHAYKSTMLKTQYQHCSHQWTPVCHAHQCRVQGLGL